MELVASVVSCPLDRSSLALWHKGIMGMVTKWPCSGLQSHVCSLSSGHTDCMPVAVSPSPRFCGSGGSVAVKVAIFCSGIQIAPQGLKPGLDLLRLNVLTGDESLPRFC